jgi:hypothetical protein
MAHSKRDRWRHLTCVGKLGAGLGTRPPLAAAPDHRPSQPFIAHGATTANILLTTILNLYHERRLLDQCQLFNPLTTSRTPKSSNPLNPKTVANFGRGLEVFDQKSEKFFDRFDTELNGANGFRQVFENGFDWMSAWMRNSRSYRAHHPVAVLRNHNLQKPDERRFPRTIKRFRKLRYLKMVSPAVLLEPATYHLL